MIKLTPEYLLKISDGWDSGENKADSSVEGFLHYHDNIIPDLDTPKAQEYWNKITQNGKYTTGREAHQLLRMLLDDRNTAFMQDPEKMAQLMRMKELAESRLFGPTGIANPADYMSQVAFGNDDDGYEDPEAYRKRVRTVLPTKPQMHSMFNDLCCVDGCNNSAVLWVKGKPYCKDHDPDSRVDTEED